MSAKLAKTIARQKEKIAEGQYYEAHQQLRVITARYLKSSDYASAAAILHNGALLLLRAGQGGSGSDLARMLINDVYDKGEFAVTKENRDVVIEILKAFPTTEPTRKRYITEMIGWSGKYGLFDKGDPEIHHEVGSLYAEESEAYEAERHLLLGTSSSPKVLSTLLYKWYTIDSPHTAGLYASRSVLPYLVLGNLSSATTSLSTFTSLLVTSQPSLPTQMIESSKSSVRIFPSLPLLNFLSLLLLACQKGDGGLFRLLSRHYASHLKDAEDFWGESLSTIGEIWCGIPVPKQSGGNPLFDMMGSMLFGGGQPGAGGPAARGVNSGQKRVGGAGGGPPVAMDLD